MKFNASCDADNVLKYLDKSIKKSKEEVKHIIKKYTNLSKGDMKREAPVDTGYLREQIASRYEDSGFTGIVQAHAEYSPHVEFGHRVVNSQGDQVGYVEGQYYARKAYVLRRQEFIDEMSTKPLSHF